MDDGGYEEQGKRWWSDEGWAWREKGERRWSDRGTDQPEYWDHPRFGKSRRGYPVVGVSWYEANAYCAWLTELLHRLREGEELPASQRGLVACLPPEVAVVRLPVEEEWEAAAGGAEGERYPWGQDWRESHANTSEGGIGATSPVGMCPSGQSPAGVWDMGGNVWEWMADWYDEERQYRTLRGGSWNNNQNNARVRDRNRNNPDNSNNNIGFRVCSSHGLWIRPEMLRGNRCGAEARAA